MNLEASWEGYLGGFGGRKGKGERLSSCYNLKNLKEDKTKSLPQEYGSREPSVILF